MGDRMANLGITEGLPYPLGATWDGKGVNFALFSAHATRVEVCLFDQAGEREDARIELPEYTNELLLDPYARGHFGDLRWDPAVFGYQMETGDDLTFDERDSAPFVPKSVVV